MTIAFPSVVNPVAFPEHRFLPHEEAAESYQAVVEGGRMAMRESRTVICGLARNVAAHLPRTIARIERLGGLFGDYRVLIYENDSTDATPAMLNRWANRNDRVTVVSQRRGKQLYGSVRCPKRGDDMAEYRNRCHREVADRWSDFDHACLLDMDLVGGFSYDGIAHSFGSQPWDAVGSYGIIYHRHRRKLNRPLHYDVWAFRRFGSYEEVDGTEGNLMSWRRGDALLPVYSCFGGLALYRMPAWLSAQYAGGDCEHVALHRQMRARGFDRQYLNPSQIVLYGRKAKRFDRALLLVDQIAQFAAAMCMMVW
jgi:hypothetical protein